MELRDILEKLSDEEQGVVNGVIDARCQEEKNRGIEAARKKGVENNRLLGILGKTKEHYAALGLDPEAADVDTRINALIDSMRSKGGKETELQAAMKRIERLEADVGNERKEKEEVKGRLKRNKMSEEVSKILKGVVFADDLVTETLIARGSVKVNDEDKTVFVIDGEERPLGEGIAEFLKTRPDLLVNRQNPGSGSAPSGKNPPKKTMPLSEFNKLSGKARSEFVKNGGLPVD